MSRPGRPSVPFFVCEEHHEAFFVWHYAINTGLMPATGNTLLHVDEHADIATPRLHRSIHELGDDLDAVWRFTYEELSCFEFLVPALYQRMFDHLYWIRQNPEQTVDQVALVRSPTGGTSFDVSAFKVVMGRPLVPEDAASRGHLVRYRYQSIEQDLNETGNLVLDIDLDYFSCEDAVNLVQKIEVTEATYASFRNDRYHFLRINQGSRIKMVSEGGKYFLYLRHYPEPEPTPLRVDDTVVVARIKAFVDYLERHALRPLFIDIARSRLSGYTPMDQWELIEVTLIEELGRMYDLDVRGVDEVKSALDRAAGCG